MKNETRLVMYTLGVVILFLAGISILSSSIQSNVLKCVIQMGIGIGLLGIACKSFEEETFKDISKIPFLLSLLSFFITYIFIGTQGLFGSAFSFYGEWSQLFVASLWLVLALLSSLMVIRYKEYLFVYVMVVSFLLFITSLLTMFIHSNLLVLFIVSIFMGILHFIKNEHVKKLGKYASLGLMLFSCLFFFSEENVYFLFLLSLVHIINLLIILYHDSSDECQMISLLLSSIYFLCLYSNYSAEGQLFLPMMTIEIALIEICVNCFSLFKNTFLKKLAKLLCTIGYLIILYSVESGKALAVILVLLSITATVNLFIFKHDENEKNVVFIKALFALLIVGNLMFPENIKYYLLLVIINFMALVVAFVGKKPLLKKEMKLLTIVFSCFLVFKDFENLQFIVTSLVILINYLFFTFSMKEQEEKYKKTHYFITLGFLFILMEQYPCNLAYLVLSCVLLLLCALHYENHLYMGITLPFILYVLLQYIAGIFEYSSITMVAEYLLLYFVGFVFSLKIVNKSKVAWLNLIFVFLSLCCFGEDTLLTTLLVLVASIVLFFISKEAGSSRAFGIVFGILSLIDLMEYLEGLGAFALLLVLGLSLLLGVFKSFKEPEKAGIKKEIPQSSKSVNTPHFCGNCGEHLEKGDKFCGSCGKKIES